MFMGPTLTCFFFQSGNFSIVPFGELKQEYGKDFLGDCPDQSEGDVIARTKRSEETSLRLVFSLLFFCPVLKKENVQAQNPHQKKIPFAPQGRRNCKRANMTVIKVTRTLYEVRVYVKGYLCAFWVEAIDTNHAIQAGKDVVKSMDTMTDEEFRKYTVPGEYERKRRSKVFDEE